MSYDGTGPTIGIAGMLTTAPSVEEQPLVQLREWRVIQAGDRHWYLLGLRAESTKLRMTTRIVSHEYQARTWVTESGRKYVTEAAPGALLTPELLGFAAQAHGLPGDIVDVTEQVWAEMLRCRH